MNAIKTTVHNRRIELPAPKDLPDGTNVLVEVIAIPGIGIAESEWRDDPEALTDWEAWLKTIEPIDWAPPSQFDDEYRRLNIEAVRKQMEAGVFRAQLESAEAAGWDDPTLDIYNAVETQKS